MASSLLLLLGDLSIVVLILTEATLSSPEPIKSVDVGNDARGNNSAEDLPGLETQDVYGINLLQSVTLGLAGIAGKKQTMKMQP
ncbi:hypothetical protein N7494_000591 [Penicillium frequentans]|uniref:Uncharacterized protein n=1 Tax=Penicillium frequentans TaxID=3151616 RepID=A0AAD6D6F6_9EURO|nr:hypothetical protein N7494_000591 [Penicillium glabrum]